MKSVPKLIRRFAAILLLSAVLLVMMNVAVFAVLVAEKAPTGNNISLQYSRKNRTSVEGFAGWEISSFGRDGC